MPSLFPSFLHDGAADLRGRIIGIYGLLIAVNVAAWGWALSAFHDYPVLLGTAFLAYSFGLRHAVDADHIAAIDNVTRKLMQEGKRPVAAGFYFSLGHSTVVVLASVGVAVTAAAVQGPAGGFPDHRGRDRHLDIGRLPAPHRDHQRGHAGQRLSGVPPRQERRGGRRRRAQPDDGGRRPVRARVPLAVPPDRGELAHVSARLPVRARLRYRDARSACWAFPPPRPRADCRCGRSWCFRRCSPPA